MALARLPRPALSWLVLLAASLLACQAASPAKPARRAEAPVAPVAEIASDAARGGGDGAPGEGAEGGRIPVTRADPTWGDALAPVTLVMWGDLECPFTQKLVDTFDEVKRAYGPKQVRLVWKNNPLAFHKNARRKADLAMGVLARDGDEAFWAFARRLLGDRSSGAGTLDEVATRFGFAPGEAEPLVRVSGASEKVADDVALGEELGVTGTPETFVNGVRVSGAQPLEKWRAAIDEQLGAARELVKAGVPAGDVYALLVEKNLKPKAPEKERAAEPDDATVWRVPVGNSPVRGKATALVTLVVFSDFQCPFCAKAALTLEGLSARYGDKLRIVFKHQPLPFHAAAEPAAQLALEARAQKGDQGFWRAHDLLFRNRERLAAADLEGHARALGLDVAAARKAIATHKHASRIDDDVELADALKASGTPHFFINGRRLVGAQPAEAFERVIDEQLAAAERLVAAGTPRAQVYEASQKGAKSEIELEKREVPPAGKDVPATGARPGAPVVVTAFTDFQCPFCKRAEETTEQLIAAFPGKVRVVYRNLPLPMHPEAPLAAEAALEAFRQQGEGGFLKMKELLWEDQSAQGLGRAALEQKAAQAGLDVARFGAALDARVHRRAVERDAKIAADAGITGTPGFVINGYFVSGAQPLMRFKRVVRRALAER
jgi:protein-disulfide isomerase